MWSPRARALSSKSGALWKCTASKCQVPVRKSWYCARDPVLHFSCWLLHGWRLPRKLNTCRGCDRIAFARWSRGNRTALLPTREQGCKACQQRLVGHFLQSGLRAGIAKLRRFPAVSIAIQADFSALQMVWRRERIRTLGPACHGKPRHGLFRTEIKVHRRYQNRASYSRALWPQGTTACHPSNG
jgi:hypothetical protein